MTNEQLREQGNAVMGWAPFLGIEYTPEFHAAIMAYIAFNNVPLHTQLIIRDAILRANQGA